MSRLTPSSKSSIRPAVIQNKISCVLKIFQALFVASCIAATSCATHKFSSELVEVKKVIPNIVLDIRYATTNNFTGQKLYEHGRTFLRRAVAKHLSAAQREFNKMGLGLKIYDAYRPLSVQRKMWAIYPHEGYVANPAKGSRHNRGAAVDVTLVDLRTGKELPMPSGYDEFSERAHRDYTGASAEELRNRELLERVMEKHGFKGLFTEWWHFDDVNSKKYELLDIDSSQIK
jgi:D-alanyl-D-alanine dipeptidase